MFDNIYTLEQQMQHIQRERESYITANRLWAEARRALRQPVEASRPAAPAAYRIVAAEAECVVPAVSR